MWESFSSVHERVLHFILVTMKVILMDQNHTGTGIGIWRNSVSSAAHALHYL